jgi:hypothetical protein
LIARNKKTGQRAVVVGRMYGEGRRGEEENNECEARKDRSATPRDVLNGA